MRLKFAVLATAIGLSLSSNGIIRSAMSQGAQRVIGPDICKGRLWIKHMAAIQSTSDSADDPMSCWFDPNSKIGKQVLRVCDEYGGTAEHGCWVRGTFVVERTGSRRLTGVMEVRKLDDRGD
jgi:hypothetical protein